MGIVDYKILESSTRVELEEKVRGYLVQGWKPQGGICFFLGAVHLYFKQAMIQEGS